MPRLPSLTVGVCLCASLMAPNVASARIFGTQPIPISVGPHGEAANGPSGHPTISGDDRKARYVAFDSAASNLVANDVNGRSDVFVWARPHGRAGLRLSRPARPSGRLVRASVSSREVQGNGDSMNPSLDGSMHRRPHCVAFQSTSTNLARGDFDAVEDVFVRNFSLGTTRLISRGVGAPAVNPSIDGDCGSVAFEAGGFVFVARVHGHGRPHMLGSGSSPSYAKDGSAIVWQQGGGVMLRAGGHTMRVTGNGSDAHVSDRTSGDWGVVFQTDARLTRNDTNPGSDVYMRVIRHGHVAATDLISASRRGAHSLGGTNIAGGITAFGALRGIVTFANDEGGQDTLYYRNNHTGNIDDLAHASDAGSIFDVATSARANFVAFSSTFPGFRFDHNGSQQDIFFKALRDGKAL